MPKQSITAMMLHPATAAEIMGVSEQTIKNMCKRGEIRACRAGSRWRIHPNFMEALPWNIGLSGIEGHGQRNGEMTTEHDASPCVPRIVVRQNAA
jgi:excisionase family DNA binding protein